MSIGSIFGGLIKALTGDSAKEAKAAIPEDPQAGGPKPGAMLGQETNHKKMSVLDQAMFALLGPPDAILTDEARTRQTKQRRATSNAATDAMNNPGESYMGPPPSSGSSFGESLSKILGILR